MGVILYEPATCELAFEDGTSAAIFDAETSQHPEFRSAVAALHVVVCRTGPNASPTCIGLAARSR